MEYRWRWPDLLLAHSAPPSPALPSRGYRFGCTCHFAIAGGFLAGALWALPAALLKAGRGVSEIITTLMLNYIAVFFISYLVKGPWQGPSEFMPQSATIPETARLPLLFGGFRLHGGTVVAILLVVAVYFLLQRTSLGYNFSRRGREPQGISLRRDPSIACHHPDHVHQWWPVRFGRSQ